MEYRKFWLVNSLGNRYDLTNGPVGFLASPEGLGFTRSYASTILGNSELVGTTQFALGDIQGELLFYANTNGSIYEAYQNFINFVKYKPIEFHYLPPNTLEDYYCDVLLTQLVKTEIDRDGVLRTPITFHRLTEWLTTNETVIRVSNQITGDGKKYNLVRPYHYAGTSLNNIEVNNQGTDDVGFLFEINGYCKNPQFTLIQDGIIYGRCKLVGEFDYVRVDSIETEESIYLERNGIVLSNPASYQDLTIGEGYVTFTRLKVGQTTINFSCSNMDVFTGEVVITCKHSYASV